MAIPQTIFERQLIESVRHGPINRTKELLSSSILTLNDERYFDYYLIMEALENRQIDIAKLLIENDFRVFKNGKSNPEKTVLHAAVESSDDTEFITTLLTSEVSLDILNENKENKTPFHLAIDRNQLSTIELFLSQFYIKTFEEKNFLHYAVEQDKVTIVTELIKEGFSIYKKNEENLTPICIALINENSQMLHKLLSFCLGQNINPKNYNDVAPVYVASMCGYLELIKEYADHKLSINRVLRLSKKTWSCLTDYSGYTFLHLAVKYIKLEVVKFLLDKGADILVQNDNGSTPLHIAFETKEKGIWRTWQQFDDNNLIIDLILKANMKVKSNSVNQNKLSHFHIACSRDEPRVVEHFLKLGAVINQPTQSQYHLYKGFYPLHFAAKFRCTRTLELLLQHGADVKKRDFKKRTALHIAAQESCLDTVHLLLDYGADITSIDCDGNSPVHWAFKNKNYAVIDLLLSVHNQVHSNPMNEGISHFHIACSRNNVQVVKSFIENGALIDHCVPVKPNDYGQSNITDWAGYSPLHFAVSHNRAKIVELLLNKGATVGSKDGIKKTPLHLACQYTYEMFGEFIQSTLHDFNKRGKITLISRQVTDVTRVSENYSNGFSECTEKIDWLINRRDHLKIINLLLNYGSDVNSKDPHYWSTPVFYAYAAVENIKGALKNNMNDCSRNLLNQIVQSLSEELYDRRKSILNNLFKMDVNLNRCYSNGSILHYICSKNSVDERDVEMMQLFLENGVDVNFDNQCSFYFWKMFTPLHVAVKSNNENAVRTLLNYDANMESVYYKNKRTALLMAFLELEPWSDCVNIMKILVDRGANINAREVGGNSALHNLVLGGEQYCSETLISILLKGGVNINIPDNYGFTPLHLACATSNFKVAETLLIFGADINVQDYEGYSICYYLYEWHLKNLFVRNRGNYLSPGMKQVIILLQNHVMKMKVIGLPISKKELWYCAKFYDFVPRTDEEKKELIDKYEGEVQILRDTKINDYYSLYTVIFKMENTLAKLVINPKFKLIVESKSFKQTYPNYGYLVQLKYNIGMDRANLLPIAKSLLDNLMGLQIPDTYSEMILSYFTNTELKESIKTMSEVLDSSEKISDTMQLRSRRTRHKRQKVY